MATNPYLERMSQLQNDRMSSNKREVENMSGVPIHRPTVQTEGSPSGVPTGKAPIPEDDESYKDSHFYTAFNHYQESDPHFSGVMEEVTKLATGLREQVNSGYMPPQIARQRLTQFIGDTMSHFERKAPQLEEEDKQRKMAQILGALGQGAQSQQDQQRQDLANEPIPNEGITQQQFAQQQAAQGGAQ